MEITYLRRSALLTAMCLAALAGGTGCTAQTPPASVLFAADVSASAHGKTDAYLAALLDFYDKNTDRDLTLSAYALDGRSGDAEAATCPPPAPVTITSDGPNPDVAKRNRRDAENGFFTAFATYLDCAKATSRTASDVMAFDVFRQLLPDGGSVLLLTDGMVHSPADGVEITPAVLADTTATQALTAQVTSWPQTPLTGIDIYVLGASCDCSARQTAALEQVWTDAVTAAGGRLAGFTSTTTATPTLTD